jgi:hypothetical protein
VKELDDWLRHQARSPLSCRSSQQRAHDIHKSTMSLLKPLTQPLRLLPNRQWTAPANQKVIRLQPKTSPGLPHSYHPQQPFSSHITNQQQKRMAESSSLPKTEEEWRLKLDPEQFRILR